MKWVRVMGAEVPVANDGAFGSADMCAACTWALARTTLLRAKFPPFSTQSFYATGGESNQMPYATLGQMPTVREARMR